MTKTISSVGEKALIRDFIKPYFNAKDDPAGVGDDCAMIGFGDEVALLSTDRVPSDLTAFKLGFLDYRGLGDYLARLNLSDIAACGGQAVGLLLNLGLPSDFPYDNVLELCCGFGARAEDHGAIVLGGDLTSSTEISISATSIGKARRNRVLSRRNARPGDSIFISRPLGLTPSALHVFLGKLESKLPNDSLLLLRRQFTDLQPMLSLGQMLAASGQAGACIDNTDGLGQSLAELSEASKCAFIIERSALRIPPVVESVSQILGIPPVAFAFDGGADFSLIGTIRGQWSCESATAQFGHPIEIIGHVESGVGVWYEDSERNPLLFHGWNYFDGV